MKAAGLTGDQRDFFQRAETAVDMVVGGSVTAV